MTLHSSGVGSGVGVSLAGSKGFSQDFLVTLAIAVHNIPEGLAVGMVLTSKASCGCSAFICADAFNKVLPFCEGFAAGCMIWMVKAEVLVGSISITCCICCYTVCCICGSPGVPFFLVSLTATGFCYSSEDASGFFVSLFFGLGPLLVGMILVSFALPFCLQHALLTGLASGIALVHCVWWPLQLLRSSKLGFIPIVFLFGIGSLFVHISTASILKVVGRKRTSMNNLPTVTGFPMSIHTLQAFLSCGAIANHVFAGLALGVAAPIAYGLGRHMVLPVSLHGLPRGAAVANCIYGATDSWQGALAAATVIGFIGPSSAIGDGSILAGIDYSGLDHLMDLHVENFHASQ